MSKAPAFQFYASDFVADTMEWTPLEVGIYMRLLCFEWINESLPPQPERLARLAGCSDEEFEKAWPLIKPKFYVNGEGRMYNKRLEETRQKLEHFKALQSEKGRRSAELRQPEPNRSSTEPPTGREPEGQPKLNSSSSISSSFSSSSSKFKKSAARAKKTKCGEYGNVLLTEAEKEVLKTEHPDYLEAIEFLSRAKEMKGYRYKSDFLALKKWVFDALKEHKGKSIMPDMQATFEETMRRYGGKHDTR
jgi:uncharacterized protein YdaU (DUF1376 family)